MGQSEYDNDVLAICCRDAINELLQRCRDLGLKKDEMLQIGDGLKSMVTFKGDVQQAATDRILAVLDKPGRKMKRDIS